MSVVFNKSSNIYLNLVGILICEECYKISLNKLKK